MFLLTFILIYIEIYVYSFLTHFIKNHFYLTKSYSPALTIIFPIQNTPFILWHKSNTFQQLNVFAEESKIVSGMTF